jgi:hypothetical protein
MPAVSEVQVGLSDDTPSRYAFVPLSETDLAQRLSTFAQPERTFFDATRGHLANAVAFQHCMHYNSQYCFDVRQPWYLDGSTNHRPQHVKAMRSDRPLNLHKFVCGTELAVFIGQGSMFVDRRPKSAKTALISLTRRSPLDCCQLWA